MKVSRVEHDKLLAEKIDEYAPDYIVLSKIYACIESRIRGALSKSCD